MANGTSFPINRGGRIRLRTFLPRGEETPRALLSATQGKAKARLYRLLWVAHAEEANPEFRPLTEPLVGYSAGQRPRISALAQKLLKVAELASQQREEDGQLVDLEELGELMPLEKLVEPKGAEEKILINTADWTFNSASRALIGITGIEGVVALLRSPGVSEIDKALVAVVSLSNDEFRIHEGLSSAELNLLIDTMGDEALVPYQKHLLRPLIKNDDPRAIPYVAVGLGQGLFSTNEVGRFTVWLEGMIPA